MQSMDCCHDSVRIWDVSPAFRKNTQRFFMERDETVVFEPSFAMKRSQRAVLSMMVMLTPPPPRHGDACPSFATLCDPLATKGVERCGSNSFCDERPRDGRFLHRGRGAHACRQRHLLHRRVRQNGHRGSGRLTRSAVLRRSPPPTFCRDPLDSALPTIETLTRGEMWR